MVPHLQHRALQHIARENRLPDWANHAERRKLQQLRLITRASGNRWQLTEAGWRGAGDVRFLHAIAGADDPEPA